ncbi:MAG: GIY-YIG nuclease family protein, partial [candidate division WOR-3 bacterium]
MGAPDSQLIAQVQAAPAEPGVYLLKDHSGKILYIGKARSLRDRLRAYLQPQSDPRLAALVARVQTVETIITRSEAEALLLEESLIKIKKPRYNVRLRDDKKYPYLKITVQEPFPRIFITRN